MSQQAYTNLTSMKSYLNIPSTDTSKDSFITLIIPQVQAFIDSYTGRTFGWGDTGDNAQTDYSNTGNLGITSATISGTHATFLFYAGTPFQVGQTVTAKGWSLSTLNGTWQVTAVSTDTTQVTVNTVSALGDQTIQNASQNGTLVQDVSNYQVKIQDSYDGLVGHTFYLRNMDIRSIDALWIGSRNIYPPVLLNPNQYVWRDDGRVILGGAYFNTYNSSAYTGGGDTTDFYGTIAAGFQTITVTYHYGYVGVPFDIAMAAEDIISSVYRLRKSQGLQYEMAGDVRIAYDINFRATLKDCPDSFGTLNRYRRINL